MSLPPIINSENTKISLGTKNVFIEITGTDIMKVRICLAILAAQFSEHCKGEWKHKVEQVKINYEGHPEKDELSPSLEYVNFEVEVQKLNADFFKFVFTSHFFFIFILKVVILG